jgi:hypothetical protein
MLWHVAAAATKVIVDHTSPGRSVNAQLVDPRLDGREGCSDLRWAELGTGQHLAVSRSRMMHETPRPSLKMDG